MTAGPPFDHYPATSGAILGASSAIASEGADVGAVGTAVEAAHRSAAVGVLGTLQSPMAAAPQKVIDSTVQISQAGVFASGAVRLFGKAVQTYDDGIDRLNERWHQAEATNFGVARPSLPCDATPQEQQQSEADYTHAVSAARERLREELRGEQRRLEAELDDAADRSAGMLDRGPNAADMAAMSDAGLLEEIWNSLQGRWTPPGHMGPYGVGSWWAGQAGTTFGVGSSWMTKVTYGRFAPRNALGRYVPVSAPWYQNAYRASGGWFGRNANNWQARPYASAAHSSWATAGKWVGRGGGLLGVGTAGFSQWSMDANRTDLSGAERWGRAGTRAVVAGGAGWGGAILGGKVGAGIGFAVGGPVGAVVGGVLGGLVGGVIGSGLGNEVADHVVDFAGEAAETAVNAAEEVGEALDDAAESVGDFFGL